MSDPHAVEKAKLLLSTGRFAEAREIVTPVVASDPEDAEAWCVLARAHLREGNITELLQAARRASQADPTCELAYRLASTGFTALGRHQQAVDIAALSVSLAPWHWAPHTAWANAAAALPDLHHQAWRAAVRATELGPHEPEAHYAVGRVALANGDLYHAAMALRHTLKLDPHHGSAANDLGVVQSRTGTTAAAVSAFAAALAVDPHQPEPRQNIAQLLRRSLSIASVVLLFALGGLGSIGPEEGERPDPNAQATALGAVAVGLLVIAGVVHWFARGLTTAGRAYLRGMVWGNTWVTWWLGCLVVTASAGISLPFFPVEQWVLVVGAGGLALLVGCIVGTLGYALSARRERRRERQPQ